MENLVIIEIKLKIEKPSCTCFYKIDNENQNVYLFVSSKVLF